MAEPGDLAARVLPTTNKPLWALTPPKNVTRDQEQASMDYSHTHDFAPALDSLDAVDLFSFTTSLPDSHQLSYNPFTEDIPVPQWEEGPFLGGQYDPYRLPAPEPFLPTSLSLSDASSSTLSSREGSSDLAVARWGGRSSSSAATSVVNSPPPMKQQEREDDPLFEQRWQALQARSLEVPFIYGVHSTKCACRPSCPSRRPVNRSAVSFFDTLDQAIKAGFRYCKRCKPELVKDPVEESQDAAVTKAARLIEDAVKQGKKAPSLNELAAGGGFSPYHFQRVFKKQMDGMSPKQYELQMFRGRGST